MASSFSIHPSHFASRPENALRDEVRAQTGCEVEADSILRCIDRLGPDPSIWRYEITPTPARAFARPTRVSWTVRAVRE